VTRGHRSATITGLNTNLLCMAAYGFLLSERNCFPSVRASAMLDYERRKPAGLLSATVAASTPNVIILNCPGSCPDTPSADPGGQLVFSIHVDFRNAGL
jgi:hypothetical protein